MITSILKRNIWIIFAISFSIPLIFIIPLFLSSIDSAFIVMNGVETTGEVIENSARSNLTVNDEPYYYIQFYYTDTNGHQHKGTTSSAYTYSDVKVLEKAGTLLIKYDPRTFDAIEADYNIFNSETIIFGVFILAFGGVAIGFWIATIRRVVLNIKEKHTLETGYDYRATVEGIGSNLEVNGVPMFNVAFSWRSDTGEIQKGSSDAIYRYEEAHALELERNITVRVKDDFAVIISKPNMTLIEREYQNLDPMGNPLPDPNKDVVFCLHCGAAIDNPNAKYCPFCGVELHIDEE